MHRLSATLLVLAALTLTGCSGSSDDNQSSNSATATSSATATPTDTASATPTPTAASASPSPSTDPVVAQGDPCKDPSVSLVGLPGLDFDRYGRICIGMSFAEASTAMEGPPVTGDASCPWYSTLLAMDDPGFYVAAVTRVDDPGAAIFMFRMTWQSDQIAAVAFDAPATPADITVGSTFGQVQSAYPTAVQVTLNDPSRGERKQLVVAQPDGMSFVFDVTDGFVTDIYWGTGLSNGAAGELCAL